MANDISPTTGNPYYSGNWKDIQQLCKVLQIGEGKLAQIKQADVNYYQEMVDREIDDLLTELYEVPLIAVNQYQPDRTTKPVFPGAVRKAARYWSAGLLMLTQFQDLATNINESARAYVDDAKKDIFKIMRFNHRLQGQRLRAGHFGHTMPPSMMPPVVPEQDW